MEPMSPKHTSSAVNSACPSETPHPPQRPKKPLSSYNFFYREKRAELLNMHIDAYDASERKKRNHRRTHGKISFVNMATEISHHWKSLTILERVKYETMSALDRKRYYEQIELMRPFVERVARQRKNRKEFDVTQDPSVQSRNHSRQNSRLPAVNQNLLNFEITGTSSHSQMSGKNKAASPHGTHVHQDIENTNGENNSERFSLYDRNLPCGSSISLSSSIFTELRDDKHNKYHQQRQYQEENEVMVPSSIHFCPSPKSRKSKSVTIAYNRATKQKFSSYDQRIKINFTRRTKWTLGQNIETFNTCYIHPHDETDEANKRKVNESLSNAIRTEKNSVTEPSRHELQHGGSELSSARQLGSYESRNVPSRCQEQHLHQSQPPSVPRFSCRPYSDLQTSSRKKKNTEYNPSSTFSSTNPPSFRHNVTNTMDSSIHGSIMTPLVCYHPMDHNITNTMMMTRTLSEPHLVLNHMNTIPTSLQGVTTPMIIIPATVLFSQSSSFFPSPYAIAMSNNIGLRTIVTDVMEGQEVASKNKYSNE